ncbi:hypothetical protein [Massilia alkalitolerans]|uniref:hypothetical protein n=1 Tax=Massilia alkalitolerans TaxID=286638 RepID=UPI0028AD40DD|nr:hypothetical protein [Massilia alkalitolerans]
MPSLSRLLLQVPLTLVILALVPTNLGKLAAFLLVWVLSFGRLTKVEAIFFVVVCVFFTGMNAASLEQGIFAFTEPDILRMPVYELVMWGFYLLHTKRLLGGAAPHDRRAAVWVLALLYSAAFASIHDGDTLLLVTGTLLAIGLILFHERADLAYAGYLILLGAAVEYTGVWSGQWGYPGDPAGGVPMWFITLWGGVGLFLRRLVLPILERFEGKAAAGLLAQGGRPDAPDEVLSRST